MDFTKRNAEFIEIMARDTVLADILRQCVTMSFRHE
jgi:hypothetical protein